MFAKRLLPFLLVASVACDDTITAPRSDGRSSSGPEAVQPVASLPGILESPNLLRSGDRRVWVVGELTRQFANLVGVEVLVFGYLDESGDTMTVTDFEIISLAERRIPLERRSW